MHGHFHPHLESRTILGFSIKILWTSNALVALGNSWARAYWVITYYHSTKWTKRRRGFLVKNATTNPYSKETLQHIPNECTTEWRDSNVISVERSSLRLTTSMTTASGNIHWRNRYCEISMYIYIYNIFRYILWINAFFIHTYVL